MPEGDTIAWHASRIRPALEGRSPDAVRVHARFARDRWGERLAGRTVERVRTRGKHLLIDFAGGLVIHSHLGMVGSWGVYGPGRRWSRAPSRAWLVLRVGEVEVVEFDGSTLELLTDGRARNDQRLARLGPDVLAREFDYERFFARLRSDDPTRPFGDALLDQRNVAGIGNLWKAEGCWEAGIDPWRALGQVSADEATQVIERVRPRMELSAREGPRSIRPRVYGLAGRPCPRCGARLQARGQGDDNRTTYWCPECQR
jgi:endonuclease VIII